MLYCLPLSAENHASIQKYGQKARFNFDQKSISLIIYFLFSSTYLECPMQRTQPQISSFVNIHIPKPGYSFRPYCLKQLACVREHIHLIFSLIRDENESLVTTYNDSPKHVTSKRRLHFSQTVKYYDIF